ncbi:MAG: DUF58 domain-containing protein [Gemmataceae bacterium]
MLPDPLLRLVRRLTLRARHLARERLAGAYESAIRGTGLTFAEVRMYQPGDDIRHFDWNVTARTGVPHVKRFVEEREQVVWLLVDASGSQSFRSKNSEVRSENEKQLAITQSKRQCAAEVGALVAFAAAAQGDRVGLIHFSDTAEQIILPNKGDRHARRVVRELFTFRAKSRRTSINAALAVLRRRRRAVVFLLSDFRDPDCAAALRVPGRKHDLVAVVVRDPAEDHFPKAGLVQLADAETGGTVLLNTSKPSVREAYARAAGSRRETVNAMLRSAGVDIVDISTAGGHLESLLEFFHRREQRR